MRESRTMQVSIYCLLLHIGIVIVTVGGFGIPLTGLNQSHFCVCPKAGHEFSMPSITKSIAMDHEKFHILIKLGSC
jgi:hypothetical protein